MVMLEKSVEVLQCCDNVALYPCWSGLRLRVLLIILLFLSSTLILALLCNLLDNLCPSSKQLITKKKKKVESLGIMLRVLGNSREDGSQYKVSLIKAY